MQEFEALQLIKKFSSDKLLNDAAVIGNWCITTDILIEGTHFTKKMTYYELGKRAIAVNLSDIAAMGGKPKYYFVSLGLPANTRKEDIQELYRGLAYWGQKFHVKLKGGDLARSTHRVVNIVVIGEKVTRFVERHTLKKGDLLFSTGLLGKGQLNNYQNEVIPRIKEGQCLAANPLVTALMDSSDGLAKSIMEMTTGNKWGIRIDKLPAAPGATADNVLYGGEDYELIFAAKKEIKLPFKTYYLGEVVPANKATKLAAKYFQHFA